MTSTLIITRPEEDAQKLASQLTRQGFRCIIEPMLAITPIYDNKKALEYALERNPQAILVTSRNAVTILAEMTPKRGVPLIAVGKATGSYASQLGFSPVAVAGGTVRALISYALSHCEPARGKLLYLRGLEVTANIARELAQNQLLVDTVTLYQALPARHFSASLRKEITEGKVNGVLFFSARTAATYARLVSKHDLQEAHRTINALCISEKVAEKLRNMPWRSVLVSAQPETNSLTELLKEISTAA